MPSCLRASDLSNMIGPELERAAFLHIVGRAVVDTGDAGFMPTDVIYDGFDSREVHTKLSHARDNGASQIMQPPRRHRIPRVGPCFTDTQIEAVLRL
jgi:hypothetical protein